MSILFDKMAMSIRINDHKIVTITNGIKGYSKEIASIICSQDYKRELALPNKGRGIEEVEYILKSYQRFRGLNGIHNKAILDGSNVIGFVSIGPVYKSELVSTFVYVKPEYRNNGIGTGVLCEIGKYIKKFVPYIKGLYGTALSSSKEVGYWLCRLGFNRANEGHTGRAWVTSYVAELK